jgi:hypothetical protein
MSDHGDYDRDDDEPNVRSSRGVRRSSPNEDSGSSSSHRCKFKILNRFLLIDFFSFPSK